ncbi:unnamed protein product [Boreogadus saida]
MKVMLVRPSRWHDRSSCTNSTNNSTHSTTNNNNSSSSSSIYSRRSSRTLDASRRWPMRSSQVYSGGQQRESGEKGEGFLVGAPGCWYPVKYYDQLLVRQRALD